MDQEKFDALVQKLTADASRRGVVRGAVGGAVGSALAAIGLESAEAKNKKGKGGPGGQGNGKGKNKGKGGPGAQECIENGERCGGGRLPKCKRCCSGETKRTPKGKKRCCGLATATCTKDNQCCEGLACVAGSCAATS